MKLAIILGPQAVGKMTVGHELEKITGLRLFHNHMTIELVSKFFDYGTETGRRLVNLFREEIFKEVVNNNLEGIIFTFVWCFDQKSDWDYIENLVKIFKDKGGEIYYVELEADIEERIRRNKTEHRLLHKPTKRDTTLSEQRLINHNTTHRLNSRKAEINAENYLRIDNTNLSPQEVAIQIKEKFNL